MNKNLKYVLIILGLLFLFFTGILVGKGDRKPASPELQRGEQEVLSQDSTASKGSTSNPSLGEIYPVLKVVDGDTIDVSIDGKGRAIRLIGIDTPEVVDPRKPVQCFGAQASQKAKETLTGKSVYLEADPTQGDTDKYKRLLRYVILPDGTNFNLMMIQKGFAHEYTYDLPYKYQSQFKAAEKEAMGKSLGLWSPSSCNENTGSSSTPEVTGQTSTSQGETVGSDYKPTGTYTCDCSKLCGAIKTCDEAYYQLKTCGCSARDSDGDGTPCESLCQ